MLSSRPLMQGDYNRALNTCVPHSCQGVVKAARGSRQPRKAQPRRLRSRQAGHACSSLWLVG